MTTLDEVKARLWELQSHYRTGAQADALTAALQTALAGDLDGAAAVADSIEIALHPPVAAGAGGLPIGGAAGQVLGKDSGTSGDASWHNSPGPYFDDEELSTDPDTFIVVETFEVGRPCMVSFRFDITAVVEDGETFATAPTSPDAGEIGLGPAYEHSFDGVTWVVTENTTTLYPSTIAAPLIAIRPIAGWGRVTFTIIGDDFNIYSGSNHPTVTGTLVYAVI